MAEKNSDDLREGGTAKGAGAEGRDEASRIGSAHGSETAESERTGYAREIGERGSNEAESSRAVRTSNSGLGSAGRIHPSRRLELRAKGYGIGGGYERPYRKDKSKPADDRRELYGPLPHSGYYGVGSSQRPFKLGQASFNEEIDWYRKQYGEKTSGYEGKKK
ncbi:MAG TPA: hypothetical protein VE262_18115 [Blastocatellia bacterium]|nr:hypothetical protein [Blastocatellia bacterium]